MMNEDRTNCDNGVEISRRHEPEREDPLGDSDELRSPEIPKGVDRRTFLMRSAVVGATAVMVGRSVSAQERTQRSTAEPPPLAQKLNVVKKQKGPVMTTLDEFYKVGPGPNPGCS